MKLNTNLHAKNNIEYNIFRIKKYLAFLFFFASFQMLLAFLKIKCFHLLLFKKFFTHTTPIAIFGPGFPSRAVVDAYIKPEVNQSRSKFSWVEPDLDALRDYLEEKIGLFSYFLIRRSSNFYFIAP